MNKDYLEDKELGGMKNVWILTISMSALAVCYTMLVPFLPVYLLELGVSQGSVAMWSGVVFSITFLIAGIMAPIWGKMADARGKKMMAIRAGIAIGISYVLIGLVTNPWQLLLGRAFQGFANGFMPAAMTLVSLSVSERRVGKALGIFQTGLILGNVIGPFLGGFVESLVGMRPVFYVSGVIVILSTLAVAFWVKEPNVASKALQSNQTDEKAPATKKRSTSLLDDWKQIRSNHILVRLLWVYFAMQCAILMLQPILALFVGEMEGSMEHAAMISGTILSVGGLAGSVTTSFWVRLGEHKGYFQVISWCLAGTGVVLLLQALPLGIYWFGALQILVGCCIVGINPSLSTAVTLHTEASFRGRMFGMATMAQQFGSMIGPLFASVITTLLGFSPMFAITGALLLYMSFMTKQLITYETCTRESSSR